MCRCVCLVSLCLCVCVCLMFACTYPPFHSHIPSLPPPLPSVLRRRPTLSLRLPRLLLLLLPAQERFHQGAQTVRFRAAMTNCNNFECAPRAPCNSHLKHPTGMHCLQMLPHHLLLPRPLPRPFQRLHPLLPPVVCLPHTHASAQNLPCTLKTPLSSHYHIAFPF